MEAAIICCLLDIIKRFATSNTAVFHFSQQIEMDVFSTFILTMAVRPLHFLPVNGFQCLFKGTCHTIMLQIVISSLQLNKKFCDSESFYCAVNRYSHFTY